MNLENHDFAAKVLLCVSIIFLLPLAFFPGCSEDSPSGPDDPGELSISIQADSISLGITETFQFAAAVTGGAGSVVEWYVNSIRGGNSTSGTISQENPATYTAPDEIPAIPQVMVKAVSEADSTKADSCIVTITFNTIYVNSATGDDDAGTGGMNKPFRTITKGLEVSAAGMKVSAAPGTYNDAIGEQFPIQVPDSVTLEGEDWETSIISLDSESLSEWNAVMLNCTDCSFRRFTLEEPDAGEPYWSTAVMISGSMRAHADSLRCLERARYAVLRVERDTESVVENCYFVVTDGNYYDRGLEIVFNEDGNGSILRNLTVSGFHTGLMFNYMQDTLVENCDLSGNSIGAELCCFHNSNSQPNPDFGGGARGSLGGNNFADNISIGLENSTANVIYAMYNSWDNDPPVEGQDFSNPDSLNGGTVIYE